MKNRRLLLIAVLVLAVAMSIGTTLAYLTDTDSDVNVMTLGDVKIEQIELQRKAGVDYRNGGEIADGDELEDFRQGQKLYPSYAEDVRDYSARIPNDEQFWWGEYVTADVSGNGASNGLFGEGLKGALDKFVFVKNVGEGPAYYRTWIALECPDSLRYDGDTLAEADLWVNRNGNARFAWSEDGYAEIGGQRYLIMCATYLNELPAGEISRPSLLQVALTGTADGEDVTALGDEYTILVYTQAVQAVNLPDAKTALTAAFGEAVAANHPWQETPEEYPVVVHVSTPAEMRAALGKADVIIVKDDTDIRMEYTGSAVVDGKGATIVMAGTADGNMGELSFFPTPGASARVENLKFTGAGFLGVAVYKQGKGNYEVNNVVLENVQATYSVMDNGRYVTAAFAHYGTAVLNDCSMTGTTNAVEGYQPYDIGFVNGTTTTINGGTYGKAYLWAQAHVTIKDAEVDTIDSGAITTRNLGMLTIGSGTHVGTLNLVPPGTYLPAITIQEGAVVDKITYKGVTYTQEEWLNR